MPGIRLVHRAGQLSGWLAIWIAALLAIAPAGPRLSSLELALPGGAAVHSDALADLAALKPEERGSQLRSPQPVAFAILSRLPPVEKIPGLPPVKPTLALLGTGALSPLSATTVATPAGTSEDGLHRDSVGTARTPTGPPL